MEIDSLHYQTVYDAAQSTHMLPWSLALLAILASVASIAQYVNQSRKPDGHRAGLIAKIAFAGGVLVLFVSGTMLDEYRTVAALRSGRYTVVEGIVSDFHPSDSGDHVDESWEVESGGQLHRFHYVASQVTPGFQQTQIHGGPVRSGLRVRVAEVDGHIARLEISP